jgi:hypothetical protein
MSKKNNGQFYIERRGDGDYAVRRGGAERASAIEPTQRAAIERAHEIDPGRAVHVERVRTTSFGQPNRWR